jgi:hypothetical protein
MGEDRNRWLRGALACRVTGRVQPRGGRAALPGCQSTGAAVKEVLTIAVPWYDDASEYADVVAMLPAAEGNDALSYYAFLAKIEGFEKQFQEKGLVTRRVPIQAVAVKAWCDARHKIVCRESINQFITDQLRAMQVRARTL